MTKLFKVTRAIETSVEVEADTADEAIDIALAGDRFSDDWEFEYDAKEVKVDGSA